MSDLHLVDHRAFEGFAAPPADVLVLAGDIAVGAHGMRWARERFPTREIVYVAGAFEFDAGTVPTVVARLRQVAAEHGVHFLERDVVTVGGVRFVGCTLWTDFDLLGVDERASAMDHAREWNADFQRIATHWIPTARRTPGGPRRHLLTPERARRWHLRSRKWLEETLASPFTGATVVVTYHAPHAASIPRRFAGQLANAASASDLSALFGGPALWVHGCLHHCCDYTIGATRVLCNPRGAARPRGAYRSRRYANRRFDPALVVTV